MFDKPIDFKKLHKELSDTYKRQMEIKKEFPHRYEWPSGKDFSWDSKEYRDEVEARKEWRKLRSEFDSLSYRMTILCCILNHAKGKLHMSKLLDRNDLYGYETDNMTLELQEAIVGNAWKEFILDDVDEFGVSEKDEQVVDELVNKHIPKKKGVVARFVNALGL